MDRVTRMKYIMSHVSCHSFITNQLHSYNIISHHIIFILLWNADDMNRFCNIYYISFLKIHNKCK